MRILKNEDNPKHLEDAKRFFVEQSGVVPIYSTDLGGAERFLEKGKVAGVISDIYFPYRNNSTWDQPEAVGVYVMMLCQKRQIPCVLNTDGNHHGPRYQWIHDMVGKLGLPAMIDTAGDKAEAKHWQEAFDALKSLIDKSSN